MTSVVKVTKANREALLADPSFVWVGRASGRLGMKKSPWGNPFKEGMDPFLAMGILHALQALRVKRGKVIEFDGPLTVAKAVECYEDWILVGILAGAPFEPELYELSGKRLGCACGDWQPGEPEIACHAVVLAKLADAMEHANA